MNRELPLYQCHKRVRALKIARVDCFQNPDITGQSAAASYGARITPAEAGYDPIPVPPSYVTKHDPQPGGYYVLYEDGYASYSPAKAFEEGYTRQPWADEVSDRGTPARVLPGDAA